MPLGTFSFSLGERVGTYWTKIHVRVARGLVAGVQIAWPQRAQVRTWRPMTTIGFPGLWPVRKQRRCGFFMGRGSMGDGWIRVPSRCGIGVTR
jgi:hypothetical protein